MATIKDVADHAGVSKSTVSHVLNGTRFVHPETARRVQRAITELGYHPNFLARSLRRHATHTIGLLVPDNANPYFADLARAIEDAGFAEGYSVILCNSDLQAAKQAAYIDVLIAKRVDGIIISSSGNVVDAVQCLVQAQVPTVVIDWELPGLPVDQLLVDNEDGGYLAGRYLARLGHRRIGWITGPSEETPSARRGTGFRRALAEVGAEMEPEAIVRGNWRHSGGEEGANELLRRDLRLTAIFAFNDVMAVGAIGALRRAGLRVPEDISVIGFDNISQASALFPGVTTIAQPIAELGQASVRLLLNRLAHPDAAHCRMMLGVRLIERESCAPVPALTVTPTPAMSAP